VQGLGGMVENVADLMSTIFTEVCSVEAQGHCWPWEGAEAKHRSALSYRTGVPPMCLFYPHNAEENLFCWALTKSWGQRYWPSIHGLSVEEESEMMRPVFDFEATHPELYDRPEPISEVGVLFSAQTRNIYKGMDERYYVREWCGWCETLMRANVPFDVITDPDLTERRTFDRLKVLVLPNAAHLSDEQIVALKAFVEGGGKAILTHETGRYDETGALRPGNPLAELIGADCESVRESSSMWEPIPGASVPLSERVESAEPVALLRPHSDAQVWVELTDTDYAAVISHRYGQGTALAFAGKPGLMTWVGNPTQHRPDPKRPVESHTVDYDRNESIAAFMIACANHLLGQDRLLGTEGVPDGLLLGIFRHEDRTVVHLVNAAGTLANNHKTIPNPAPLDFPDLATLPGGSSVMTIRLRCPGERAVLVSPEFEGERALSLRRKGDYAVVQIPSEWVRCTSMMSVL
ncbi:MAG: beta-galactosidase trimerization domain-containing protein, partial [Candidatus Latescibacteria bacterium]|nr:beta-galactosidase trimerization domain-containing protein [Candidatus Latescibacterota bacterium]